MTLREQAEANVLAVRGSYDAPGFGACVEAELSRLVEEFAQTRATPFPSGPKTIILSTPK